jgi:hypothetical protein
MRPIGSWAMTAARPSSVSPVKRRIISVSDDAGADGVDADVRDGVVERGRPGESDEAVLGGGVGGLTLEGLEARARRRVDDRAAAVLQHELDLVLHAHEGTAEASRHEASHSSSPISAAGGAADAAGRSGDEGDLAVKAAAHGVTMTLIDSPSAIAR